MFKISDTHFAATWLLDPRAPKVEMPPELRARIDRMLKERCRSMIDYTKEPL
jgi:oligopeptide transport system ATP-binding protein